MYLLFYEEKMVINFQEITFKNILSFGAIPKTFKFNAGISLISGLNGQGKCVFKNTKIKLQMDEKIYEKYINTINRKK
jgi:hypothetical protein